MAEIVGLVTSIFAIIELTAKVIQLSHGYIGAVKQAPKDIAELEQELKTLGKVLEDVQAYIIKYPQSSSTTSLVNGGGFLRQCKQDLEQLQKKLVPKESSLGAFRSLKWPFDQAATKDLISKFERYKSTFNLTLAIDNMSLTREMQAEAKTSAVVIQGISADQKARIGNENALQIKEKRNMVLEWLSPKDFEKQNSERHADICSKRQSHIGEWLLKTFEFRGLVAKSLGHPLLWGFGIPGAGKTFLSSVVIDHFLAASESCGVAYIYFHYKEREQQKPTHILGSLVRQLAAQITALPTDIEKLYDKLEGRGKKPTFNELYAAFLATFKSFDQVFLVFDALDECDPKSQRKELLPLFHRMGESGAKLFVTSRHYPEDIQYSFRNSSKIELSPKGEDIGIYIQDRIDQDSRAKRLVNQAKCQDRIVSELVDCSQGMFLLARFHLDYLCEQTNAKQILTALNELKTSPTQDKPLDPTYNRAMDTLRSQSHSSVELAFKTFMWLTKAKRTLTVNELREAVSVELNRYELDELDLPDISTILHVCAGLVTIDEKNNTIGLVHYTAEEYLFRNSIIPENADFMLAATCATFLSFDIFAQGPCVSNTSLKDRLEAHPFLEYAAKQLPFHLKDCGGDMTTDIILKFLGGSGSIASYLQALHCRDEVFLGEEGDGEYKGDDDKGSNDGGDEEEEEEEEENGVYFNFDNYPKERHALHIASTLGHLKVVLLLLNDVDVLAQDSYKMTALHGAAFGGHEEVVRLLLEKGADYSIQEITGDTALHVASDEGHEGVVRLLLETGSDCLIEVREMHGQTPLHIAACEGCVAVMQLLIKNGADIKTLDIYGETALHSAVWGGSEEAVHLLLENGADFSVSDKDGETPLHEATRKGNKKMVEMLLDKGASILALDHLGYTPIHRAIERGHDAIVHHLLEKGADFSTTTKTRLSPLHSAAAAGHISLVQLLLEKGVDISAQDDSGMTALFFAAIEGHEAVVRMLLENGADISFHDTINESTALHHAAVSGYETIVELLLSRGADHSALNKAGFVPLHYAAENGSEQTVRLLLDKGADPQAGVGDRVLSIAASYGREAMVALLLERGADVSSQNPGNKATALHTAASGGYNKVVELLLKKGVDLSTQDSDGATALHWAAAGDNEQTVRLLLDKGADILAVTGKGDTALGIAASHGYEMVVRLLLERGADVSFQNPNSRASALHYAAYAGSDTIVKMLLDKGIDILASNGGGDMALDIAASYGHEATAKVLLEHGADVSFQNPNNGRNVLHYAARAGPDTLVKILLEKGADAFVLDKAGSTTLHYAAVRGREQTVRLLLDKAIDILAINEDGNTAVRIAASYGHMEAVKLMLEHGADVSSRNPIHGYTVLHHAANSGKHELVELLLGWPGVEISVLTAKGSSVLYCAASSGNLKTVQILFDKGFDILAINNVGRTVLHAAAQAGHIEVAQFLIEKGVDISIRESENGRTASEEAVFHKHDEVAHLIESVEKANESK